MTSFSIMENYLAPKLAQVHAEKIRKFFKFLVNGQFNH